MSEILSLTAICFENLFGLANLQLFQPVFLVHLRLN
jgi:hypothetical protein